MIEALEAGAVVEVTQVRELVAQRVDQARVPQRHPGRDVTQANPDRAVGVADPVAALDVRTLGLDTPKLQTEVAGDARGVASKPLDQLPILTLSACSTHLAQRSTPTPSTTVKGRRRACYACRR